jgi:hypothetical protein
MRGTVRALRRRKIMDKAKILLLAFALAGGCNSADNLKRAEQQEAENRQEALQQRAELNQEHQEEQQDLNREIAENEQDLPGTQGVAEERVEEREEARADRRELNQDQAKERNALENDLADQRAEDAVDVKEAKTKVEKKRQEIASDTREELTKLDQRTQKLATDLNTKEADAEDRSAAASALAKVPDQRQAIESDLEALETVRAENLDRARSNLKKRLSALDNTLDKAESKL